MLGATGRFRYLLVVSATDPVAPRVAERWPNGEATGEHVDGVAIREVVPGVGLLRRGGPHVHDEDLDRRLPGARQRDPVPLIFPSVHRSESGTHCFTAHPLGNPGAADLGGRPGTLVPSAPGLMTDALRRLDEAGAAFGTPATFEATHHGPHLSIPAAFVEIGFGTEEGPSEEAVRALANVLLDLEADDRDRIAVGLGGGHYAPHFTDLALERRWAFGHILSRHALAAGGADLARRATESTAGAAGYLYHRAADHLEGPARGLSPRLRENESERRRAAGPTSSTGSGGSGAGT